VAGISVPGKESKTDMNSCRDLNLNFFIDWVQIKKKSDIHAAHVAPKRTVRKVLTGSPRAVQLNNRNFKKKTKIQTRHLPR
jgi:hypothetical protein